METNALKVTTKTLMRFLRAAEAYVNLNPKERSKVTYALNKLTKRLETIADRYRKSRADKMEDIQAELCSKDEKGNFLETHVEAAGQLFFRKKFTKDGDSASKKKIDEAYEKIDSELVEFEPHIVDVPSDINISFYNEFKGFIFKEMSEGEEEKWYLAQQEEEKKE